MASEQTAGSISFVFWLVGFGQLILALFTIFNITNRNDLDGAAKGLWVLIALLFPIIGPIVYWVAMDPNAGKGQPPKTFNKNFPRPGSTRPPRPRC